MGIIIIPIVITIILAIILKRVTLYGNDGIIVSLIISGVISTAIILIAVEVYYDNRSTVAQYHFNPCGSKAFYLADEMAQHREFHDDWFIGVFYSDSLANLPYPQCEQ
jgi:hypothetical protein